MEMVKTVDEIERLIVLLEDKTYLPSQEEQDLIAHYIRYSAPFKVIHELEKPVFEVLTKCEDQSLFIQETHDARNALARLYGYQILQLI